MPNNIPIEGDDQPWKKEVDRELVALRQKIDELKELLKAKN